MPQPLLFPLVRLQSVRSARQIGNPRLLAGVIPLPQQPKLTIVGVTRDSTGAVLVSATVKLYRTDTDAVVETTTSDGVTGAFTFERVGLGNYYTRAYKTGVPDVAGTSLNSIAGAVA